MHTYTNTHLNSYIGLILIVLRISVDIIIPKIYGETYLLPTPLQYIIPKIYGGGVYLPNRKKKDVDRNARETDGEKSERNLKSKQKLNENLSIEFFLIN